MQVSNSSRRTLILYLGSSSSSKNALIAQFILTHIRTWGADDLFFKPKEPSLILVTYKLLQREKTLHASRKTQLSLKKTITGENNLTKSKRLCF